MVFDESNMEVLHTAEVDAKDGRGTILVRLFSWKGASAKISLTRRVDRDGEPGFAKLGGIALGEAEVVIDGINECLAEASKLSASGSKDSVPVRKRLVKKDRKVKRRTTK